MNEASYLIAAEVLKHLKYKKVTVQTPLTKTTGKDLAQQVILVPILRAGLGLLEGFVKFLPDAEKGHIGLYRDEQTYEPVEYLFKLPKTKNKKVLVLDPMLATGNSSIAAINLIMTKGHDLQLHNRNRMQLRTQAWADQGDQRVRCEHQQHSDRQEKGTDGGVERSQDVRPLLPRTPTN